MEIENSKSEGKIYTQELCNGDVFKKGKEYYMKCNIGFKTSIECVNLKSGEFCVINWDVKVKLIKGKFVCNN